MSRSTTVISTFEPTSAVKDAKPWRLTTECVDLVRPGIFPTCHASNGSSVVSINAAVPVPAGECALSA